MNELLNHREEFGTAIIFIALFAFMYVLLLPFSNWIVRIRASGLLAYLACGTFCFILLYICAQSIPGFADGIGHRMLLQYFAYFGLIIGSMRLIRGYIGAGKHSAGQKNRRASR